MSVDLVRTLALYLTHKKYSVPSKSIVSAFRSAPTKPSLTYRLVAGMWTERAIRQVSDLHAIG